MIKVERPAMRLLQESRQEGMVAWTKLEVGRNGGIMDTF